MGYVTKTELMETLSMESSFSNNQIALIDKCITIDKIYNDTELDLNAINTFEKEGILSNFYKFCKKHCYFPKWLDNIEKGIDHIN